MNSDKSKPINYSRKEIKPQWCLGCGAHILFHTSCEAFKELNVSPIIVSGIGCTARGAAYFNLNSIHGVHGRAIPIALGVKYADPKLKVLVFSGDGDLTGIGGNHLIHAARRNDDIMVICNDNEVFGMTGGQLSPTTKKGAFTTTTPEGSKFSPINLQGIITSNKKYFYARTSPMYKDHLKKCLKEALKHKGFSFIEVVSPCIISYKKQVGGNAADAFKEIRLRYKICEENRLLKDDELGIVEK